MKTSLSPTRVLAGAVALPLVLALAACSGTTRVTGTAEPALMPSATAAPASPAASGTGAPSSAPSDATSGVAAPVKSTAPASYRPIADAGPGKGLDFGYLTSATDSAGTVTISFDRATFESSNTFPDDYRITNTSKQLRSFPVAAGAGVRLLKNPGGGADLVTATPKQLVAAAAKQGSMPVWLRHTDGLTGPVTGLTEQYLP